MPESNIPTNNQPESIPTPAPLSVDVAVNHPICISESKIQEIVSTVLGDYDWRTGEISVAIVDDPTIHRLNREYLGHDYETDVLSFVLECDKDSRSLFGEIVVSADTAESMAAEHEMETGDELMLYVIHGSLHLAGLDDKETGSRSEMRAAEQQYTTKFGIEYMPPDEPEATDEVV